jgi:hypothetical protein
MHFKIDMISFIENNQVLNRHYNSIQNNIQYIILSIFMIGLFYFEKKIFFVSLFIALDVINSIIENGIGIKSSIIHTMEFGIYLISYSYGFMYGLILIFFYALIRIVTFDFSFNKLKKILFFIPITIILANTSFIAFPFIAVPLYFLRYTVEMTVLKTFEYKKLPKKIIRISLMILLFLGVAPVFLSFM